LEVSVTTNEELAESVADVMARFAPGGVVLGYQTIEPDPDGEGTPRGPLIVRAYLPFDTELETQRQLLTEALWHLGQISSLPEPEFREVVEQDWSLEWKKNYHPLRIGSRLMILPSWIDLPPAPGDAVIRLDPGMAFGTGMHPTTQLCLEALEDLVVPGMEVIDVGCGSGILAIAALQLGAGRATGVDIDPEAVRIARENANLNGVGALAEFRPGSLQDLLSEGRSAPLVCANILAVVLRQMLSEGLANLLRPGGHLVLSGILEDQSGQVASDISANRLHLKEKLIREDWVALVVTR
jgi:ribosomal protein L11 methyltransferase